MTYVIAEPCIDIKDLSCIDVCPVDCIHVGERMLVIDPEECIDCGACEPECPVEAIFPEDALPEKWEPFVKINAAFNERHGQVGDARGRVRDRARPQALGALVAAGRRLGYNARRAGGACDAGVARSRRRRGERVARGHGAARRLARPAVDEPGRTRATSSCCSRRSRARSPARTSRSAARATPTGASS